MERILRFPALGWIMENNEDTREFAEFAADQLRRLAISISHQNTDHGRKCFLFTSIKPGGGTTQLCLDLARELAHIGTRTVAVEANAFRPDSRYESGQPGGLVDLIEGGVLLEDIVAPAEGNLPDRIAVGDTKNLRHLDFNSRLIESLRECPFDICLIDSPPILLSADTEFLSRDCDATILVIEGSALLEGELRRANSILEKIRPPLVGFIANRIHVKKGSGYFSLLLKEYDSGRKVSSKGWFWNQFSRAKEYKTKET
ncbi:MAG: hypothetical protein HQL31_06860 [Planctomycetes bacterium]|nr:hypothetical protein [Planctomycetota bacterium]